MDLDSLAYRSVQVGGGIVVALACIMWYLIATASHSVELRDLMWEPMFGATPLTLANGMFFVGLTALVFASMRLRLLHVGD